MRTRGGHDCSDWFREFAEALGRYKGGPFILEGEVRVNGRPRPQRFDRLPDSAVRRCFYPACDPVVFCAFKCPGLQNGRLMFEQAVYQLELERVVAKRLDSPYRPGQRSTELDEDQEKVQGSRGRF